MKKIGLFNLHKIFYRFIISGSVFAQSGRTVTFDGVTYQVVTRPADFITAFKNQNPAAIIFRFSNYLQIGREIISEAERQNIDVTQVYDPSTLVKANNMQLIARAEVLRLIMPGATVIAPDSGNTVNANDEVYMFNKVRPVSNISRQQSADNLLIYFKYLARVWWTTINAQQRNDRICDSCYKGISYGNGYIYGYVAGNVIRTWRLWCNDCMNERIQKYREHGHEENGFFEAEDVRRANDYAAENR